MLEQGKSVRSPLHEEQGVADTTRDELTAIPIPHPPAPLEEEVEKIGSEVEREKKGGVGGRCFKV